MKLLENTKLDVITSALCMDTGDCKIMGRVESYSCKMAGNDKRLYKQLSHQDSNGSGGAPSTTHPTTTTTTATTMTAATSIMPTTGLQALSPPVYFVGSPVFPGTSPASPHGLMPPSTLIRTMSGSSATQGYVGGGGGGGDGPQLCDTISSRTLFYLQSTLTASFQPDYDFTDAKSGEFSRAPSMGFVRDAVRCNLSAAAGERFAAMEDQLWRAIDEEIRLQECDIYSYNPDLDSDPYGEEGSLWSFNFFFYNKKLKRIVFFSCHGLSSSVDGVDSVEDDMEDFTEDMEMEQLYEDSAYDSFSSQGNALMSC